MAENFKAKNTGGMIDVHVHTQVGDLWRFKYSDPDLDEVPKFQVLIDFPFSSGINLGEIFGYRFPIPTNSEEYLLQAFGENWKTIVGHKEYYTKVHLSA